ncbi:MAG TPA: ribosome biogenesis GTP-binding protein YihA/YsxC [bacterium]|nr:ribosome biogenesis GTP-binding protein YihA/YsxC [bacterium]HPS30133.1 ribosome biogenesis GTP-binding protein YihA/YsxC [bacterium]
MIIKKSDFLKSASSIGGLPDNGFPEFAFIGRSNVGKSSLMNMLLDRKGLVKTSKKPGKTVLLNFFSVNDSFFFVDLPGYGFASRPRGEQELWRKLIEEYLIKRETLVNIFLLIDARHGIMKIDEQMMEFLNYYRLSYTIVFTKIDKLNKNEASVIKFKNKGCFTASAVTGAGKEELLDFVEKNINAQKVEQ